MKPVVWYPTPAHLMRRDLVDKLVPKILDGEFLEVGIGEGGGLLKLLNRKGFSGLGVDFSETAVKKARNNLKDQISPSIVIEKRNVWNIKKKFNLILAMEVLEHSVKDDNLLGHLYQLLNSQGVLITSVPAHQSKWGPNDEMAGHIRRYEKKKLNKLLKNAGFRKVNIYSYGFPLLNLSLAIGNWWLKRISLEDKAAVGSKNLKTKKSGGRYFNTPLKIFFNQHFAYPFSLLQRFFLNFDWGVGYLVRARKGF